MDTGTFIAIVVALALVGVVLWLLMDRRRSGELRSRFGPEYDRTLDAYGSRRQAEDRKDHHHFDQREPARHLRAPALTP